MTITFIAFIGRHVGSAKRKRPAVRFLTRLLWCEAPSTARLGTLPRANDSTPCHFASLDVQDGSVATDQQLPAFGRQWSPKARGVQNQHTAIRAREHGVERHSPGIHQRLQHVRPPPAAGLESNVEKRRLRAIG